MVQLPKAGIVPADMVMLVAPGAALRLWPTQVLLAAGEAATEKPAPMVESRLSVKAVMVAAVTAGLVSVMVKVLLSPAAWVVGEKALVTLAAVTVRVAVDVPLLVPRLHRSRH